MTSYADAIVDNARPALTPDIQLKRPPARRGQPEKDRSQSNRQATNGKVDPERPAPPHAGGQPATERRTEHGRRREDGSHGTEVAGSSSGGNEVGDDRLHQDQQAAAPRPWTARPAINQV